MRLVPLQTRSSIVWPPSVAWIIGNRARSLGASPLCADGAVAFVTRRRRYVENAWCCSGDGRTPSQFPALVGSFPGGGVPGPTGCVGPVSVPQGGETT